MSLLVVGSVAIDHVHTQEEQRENLLGGSASYASVAASFFSPVQLVGIIGEDFPASFIKLYKEKGIDLEGLEHASGKTFHWAGIYEKDMNKRTTLVTDLNVFEHFSPKLPSTYKSTAYTLLANIGPDLQLRVLDQLTSARFIIADTMDLWINIAQAKLLELMARIDMLILNDEEARLLSGEHNLLRAARWLRQRGPRYVAIKKGEHGCLFSGSEETFVTPAFALEHVVDPTGAGDTFAGAIGGYIASTRDTSFENLRRAIIHGTILASFTVEDFSLYRLVDLTQSEYDSRLQSLRTLTTY